MHPARGARLLIHPPFADPTQPYVSLPTLKGWLAAKGQEVELLDLNVEAAHWLLAPASLASLAARVERLCVELNRKRGLSFEQQRQYRAAWLARPRIALAALGNQNPIDVFQDRERFFDLETYERARLHAEAAFDAVNALHFPYRYSWNGASHSVVPWSFALLERHAREPGPLDEMYRDLFESGPRAEQLRDAEFIGFSLAFPSQIPEAIRLARRLRPLAPRAFFAFGGPSIHQVAVHLEEELRLALLDVVDGIGLFEGERLLEELLPRLADWGATRDNALLLDVPNLLMRDPVSGLPRIGPRWTLDLREAPAPDPTGLDLDRYLAPSRTLLYAPTRGCYWNQCSFCYYGLSETATASYREIPPERAAADMEELSKRHSVTNFYISCDVLSPVYAVRLARAIAARGLDVRWSSDLKIERYFNEERAAILRAGGLRSAAFGIESGSDRILELMRKGCDRATMTRVNAEFHAAGIATQWMTFTDHPGEALDEALATVSWVEEERERIGLFIVGEFGLERGSAIFQDPKAFGLSRVSFAEGDELRLYALYEEEGGGRSAEEKLRVETAVRRASAGWRLNPYPWAGANSTHHSFLHFVERGADVFREDAERQRSIVREVAREASRLREPERPRFSLAEIGERERRFFERYLARALYTTLPERLGGPGFSLVALSIDDYERQSARQRELGPG